MSMHYAILIGGTGVKDVDKVQRFDDSGSCQQFCEAENAVFQREYSSEEDYLNDTNSLEWNVYNKESAKREFPELVDACDRFMDEVAG